MQLGLEELAALAAVAAAAGYLVRIFLGAVSRRAGVRACSSCSGCSSPPGRVPEAPQQVVSIGLPPRNVPEAPQQVVSIGPPPRRQTP